MLKRHLWKGFDMSLEEYRRRWALPVNYPMVAPNYAKKRSKIAKNVGLGTRER
jgi:predicted transcriptional regulator